MRHWNQMLCLLKLVTVLSDYRFYLPLRDSFFWSGSEMFFIHNCLPNKVWQAYLSIYVTHIYFQSNAMKQLLRPKCCGNYRTHCGMPKWHFLQQVTLQHFYDLVFSPCTDYFPTLASPQEQEDFYHFFLLTPCHLSKWISPSILAILLFYSRLAFHTEWFQGQLDYSGQKWWFWRMIGWVHFFKRSL